MPDSSAPTMRPVLTHVYAGPGHQLVDGLPGEEVQRLTGAFRVIVAGESFAIIGNGEVPEGTWLVTRMDNLELALQRDPSARQRPFAPLPGDHPFVLDGKACPGCDQRFEIGDVTTLIAIGPGEEDVERQRAWAGQAYTCVSIPAHWACVTGSDDPVRDFEGFRGQLAEERAELERAAAGASS